MTTPLTAPNHPLTEPPRTHDRLWLERAIAAAFNVCRTCCAFGAAPCRTPRGREVPDHKLRGRS